MWPNRHFPADLVTFTEKILNGKLHFLCSGYDNVLLLYQFSWWLNLAVTGEDQKDLTWAFFTLYFKSTSYAITCVRHHTLVGDDSGNPVYWLPVRSGKAKIFYLTGPSTNICVVIQTFLLTVAFRFEFLVSVIYDSKEIVRFK